MDLDDLSLITSEAELRALHPAPMSRATDKVLSHLDQHCRTILELAPFCVLSTQGPNGADVSPRGDPPGFIRALDEKTVLLPDRVGNNRLDAFVNILSNPRVGLLVRPALGLGGPRWRAVLTAAFRTRSREVVDTDLTEQEVGGDIGHWSVGARGCWLPKLPPPRLSLPLCGAFEAGQVLGTGFGFEGTDADTIPWLAMSLSPGVGFSPVPAFTLLARVEAGFAPLGGSLAIDGLGTVTVVGPVFGRFVGGVEVRFGARSSP